MASKITQVNVFVSSPSDLTDEREIAAEVCTEISLDRGRREGFVVQPLMWETHTRPTAGPSPQTQINSQMGDRYDIFVGFLGHRFGTPTLVAGSGTEEEFDRAYARYEKKEKIEILFYFRDPQTSPGKISARDLLKVEEFKEKIKEKGVTYGSYTSTDEFKTLLSRHLSAAVSEVIGPQNVSKSDLETQIVTMVDPLQNLNSIDNGVNDQLEDFIDGATDNFETFGTAAAEIASAVGLLGTHFDSTTLRLQEAMNLPPADREATGRKIIERSAQQMEIYTQKVALNLPLMHESMSSGLDAIRRAIMIAEASGMDRKTIGTVLLEPISSLRPTIAGGMENLEKFSQAIATFPRMTSTMNRAKRRLNAVNEDIFSFFERCIQQIDTLLVESEQEN